MIHRVRELLMRQQTQLINAIRGHLAEFRIVGPDRAHNMGWLTSGIEDETDASLPPILRRSLRSLVEQLREIETKPVEIEQELVIVARKVEACRRIMAIPGVGIITATVLVASMRDLAGFKSGRHFAAWLGLVPRQHSTGGVDKLGGISKRGDGYLWRLLVHGGRSVMRWRGRSWTWLAVALADKTARTVWALLQHGGVYREEQRQAA